MSSRETAVTTVPRPFASTGPSAASWRRASRTGVRLHAGRVDCSTSCNRAGLEPAVEDLERRSAVRTITGSHAVLLDVDVRLEVIHGWYAIRNSWRTIWSRLAFSALHVYIQAHPAPEPAWVRQHVQASGIVALLGGEERRWARRRPTRTRKSTGGACRRPSRRVLARGIRAGRLDRPAQPSARRHPAPIYRWFPMAKLNVAANALDR